MHPHERRCLLDLFERHVPKLLGLRRTFPSVCCCFMSHAFEASPRSLTLHRGTVQTVAPSVLAVPRGTGETPKHSIRVPDDLWRAAQRVADDRDETLTAVIVRALERYVRAHPLGED